MKKKKENKKAEHTPPFPNRTSCPTTDSFQVLLHIHKKCDLCMLLLGVGLAPQRDGKMCDCWMKAKRKRLSQQQPWRCFQCLLYLEDSAKPSLPSYGFCRLFPAFPFNIRTQKNAPLGQMSLVLCLKRSNLRRAREPSQSL